MDHTTTQKIPPEKASNALICLVSLMELVQKRTRTIDHGAGEKNKRNTLWTSRGHLLG